MTPEQLRRWHSWEDYMRDWCRRADFRAALLMLLEGEDPAFVAYLRELLRSNGASRGQADVIPGPAEQAPGLSSRDHGA
jgi:hypothetical protein